MSNNNFNTYPKTLIFVKNVNDGIDLNCLLTYRYKTIPAIKRPWVLNHSEKREVSNIRVSDDGKCVGFLGQSSNTIYMVESERTVEIPDSVIPDTGCNYSLRWIPESSEFVVYSSSTIQLLQITEDYRATVTSTTDTGDNVIIDLTFKKKVRGSDEYKMYILTENGRLLFGTITGGAINLGEDIQV